MHDVAVFSNKYFSYRVYFTLPETFEFCKLCSPCGKDSERVPVETATVASEIRRKNGPHEFTGLN